MTSPHESRVVLFALAALTVLAFALRLRGIDHGLPVAVEQDCKIPRQVELLREDGDRWRRDPEMRWYPLLVAEVARLWPEPKPAASDATLDEHLAAAARPHEQVRITVALLGCAIVPLTWLLASWFVGRGWALLAAALVAFSLLHVNFSQQSRPHAVAGAAFLAAVLAAVRLRRRGDLASYALAGITAALAIGCLQSGLMVLTAPIAAYALRPAGARKWLDARVLVVVAALALAVPLFYPFALWGEASNRETSGRVALSFLEFHATPRMELDIGDHRIFLDQFVGRGAPVLARTLWSYEPVLLGLLVIAGLVVIARAFKRRAAGDEPARSKRDLWVVLAFVLPYALIVALYERSYERFVIPLLPYFACAAAFGVRELVRRVAVLNKPSANLAVAAIVLALPASATWKLGTIRSAPHTTSEAAAWLRDHRSTSDDIALWPQLDVPLCREPAGLTSWMGPIDEAFTWVWARYQARLPQGHGPPPLWRLRWWKPQLARMSEDPARYVREQGGDWLVLEVYADNRVYSGATKVREFVRANAELVARFSPDGRPDYSEHPLGYQDESSVAPAHFFARVWQARTTGPVIEIYRLQHG